MQSLWSSSPCRSGPLLVSIILVVGTAVSCIAHEPAHDKEPAGLTDTSKAESLQPPEASEAQAPLRILVIGAHPADVFDQSGGTMAHHVKRGDWVGCVVVTTGVRVHDKVIVDQMQKSDKVPEAGELTKLMDERIGVKQQEVIHACSILGVPKENIHFLGVSDTVLLVNEATIRRLAKLIRELRPDIVLTHYPHDRGGLGNDHATTGQMVSYALPLAASVDPGDTNPPHKVAQVYFFGQGAAAERANLWGAQGGFYNDIFVDITDVADKKFACLNAMKSQGYEGDYAKKRIETSDGAFGSRVRVPYAEGFISLYSTTHYYLPVSKIDLDHAKASDNEAIKRRSYRLSFPEEAK